MSKNPETLRAEILEPLARAGAWSGIGFALVLLLDLAPHVLVADPGNRLQQGRFRGFGNLQASSGARLARPGSRLQLDGLGAGARVELRAGLARAAPLAWPALVNGRTETWHGAADLAELRLTTEADAQGRLELRFDPPAGVRPLAVTRVDAHPTGLQAPVPLRLLEYAVAVALFGLLLSWAFGTFARMGLGAGLGGGLLAVCLTWDRFTTLVLLPSVLLAGAFGLACGLLAVRWGAERRQARFIAAAALLRLGLVVQPSFPCIDVGFHSGTLVAFGAGELIVSRAPNPDRHAGALPMPYPPAAYALLEPLSAFLPREPLVRLALGLLEGSAPLLVLLLGRAGGLAPAAAGAAAATAAVMPEGLLVLGKGLLANALASWAGLAALLGLLRRRLVLFAAFLALALLSHFGETLLLVPLLLAWLAYAWRCEVLDARQLRRVLLSAGTALGLAWWVYYREVAQLALATSASLRASWTAGSSFHGLRLVQLGKILQNLLLKFGALPVLLAIPGLRRASPVSPLWTLVAPWLGVGLAAAAAAVVTPVPLRFEYFCVPALALAVGLGVQAGASEAWLRWTWRSVFALQAVMGWLLLTDRFRLMSVILESTLWPWPVRF